MIKPQKLKKGDKVAVVSLSSGLLGQPNMIHKYYLAKKRLEEDFGLQVVAMPNALKGIEYLKNNPKARADDLMMALKDKSVKAIICAIGGSDSYRLLPYIDFDVIKNNPKIFTGFSDSTTNHLMFYKAGVVSFYGPNIMCNFGQYGEMYDYEVEAVKNVFFNSPKEYEIKPCEYWSNDFIPWDEKNINKMKKVLKDDGYEVLQGTGKVSGKLLGGCVEILGRFLGVAMSDEKEEVENTQRTKELNDKYNLFPSKEEWKDKILFIETSEEKIKPENLKNILIAMKNYGILDNINGIIVGKPQGKVYYEEYKKVYHEIFKNYRKDLPIFYNVNFGHAEPINIIPYGVMCEVDCDNKKITIKEKMLAD